MQFLQLALDWSEIWALFIPLTALHFWPYRPAYMKPVIIYLWIALGLNTIADLIVDLKPYFPSWLQSNNPIYNLHSVVRFVCFSSFFLLLGQPYFGAVRKLIAALFGLFVVVNFTFFQDFFFTKRLSGSLLSAEAFLLLVFCMLYYLSQLKEEDESIIRGPDFWVSTGLCVYVVINFFVFLFYSSMIMQDVNLAIRIWNVHNIAFILFCVFIATAFYVSPRTEYRK
jgi:hypothetical protein